MEYNPLSRREAGLPCPVSDGVLNLAIMEWLINHWQEILIVLLCFGYLKHGNQITKQRELIDFCGMIIDRQGLTKDFVGTYESLIDPPTIPEIGVRIDGLEERIVELEKK